MGAARKIDPTFEWFCHADLRRYRGKYVALARRQVAGASKDPRVALAQAKRRFPRSRILIAKIEDADLMIL
jgi:hypothetical protein